MTNEQLSARAKAGDRAALTGLWENTRRICYRAAMKYRALCESAGLDWADIKQVCFFGFHEAVQTFDPDKGLSFNTCLTYPTWSAAQEALGIRGKKELPPKPISLQNPIGEDDESELQDLLPDSCQSQQEVVEHVYNEHLRAALERALAELPERRAEAMRRVFLDGQTRAEAARCMGCSVARVGEIVKLSLAALQRSPHLAGYQPRPDKSDTQKRFA